MEINHSDDGKKGKFFIQENGKSLAEMTYIWVGDEKIIIDHTEVDDVLRGKGAGKQLLTSLVEFARAKKIKVIPLCPFAKSVFDKVEAFQDVL